MAKKPYDVSKRFQEVAKRATETGPIHTGPSKKSGNQFSRPTKPTMEDEDTKAYVTRPGRSGKSKGDVNLPINTASSEVKDRMAKLRAMRKK